MAVGSGGGGDTGSGRKISHARSPTGKEQKTRRLTRRGGLPRRFASFQQYPMATAKASRTISPAMVGTMIARASRTVFLRGKHTTVMSISLVP